MNEHTPGPIRGPSSQQGNDDEVRHEAERERERKTGPENKDHECGERESERRRRNEETIDRELSRDVDEWAV